MLASLSIGFLFGALAILAAEALLLYYFFIIKLNLKTKKRRENQAPPDSQETQRRQSLESKQGVVWVLEPEKVPKSWQDSVSREQRVSREQKRKKEFYEVSPVKKHAKLKNQLLLLKESDGSQTAVPLKSCTIEAVSSTSLASRKWAKRFPLKLESKTAILYKGSKIFYIYLETSWEKESWCKALRSASCDDKEKLDRFAKLQEQFQCYLTLLNAGYPSFTKYSGVVSAPEPADRANRVDGSPSKVRLFLKKFSKKNAKVEPDNKLNWTSSLGREEKKIYEKFRPSQDSVSVTSSSDPSPPVKRAQSFTEGNTIPAIPPASTLTHCGSQSHSSVISDAESDEKLSSDEGTLCLNLLLSRLFFDAKSSVEIKRSIQALIQRTLSNMRTPSYVGDVICTDLNIGNLPPYIHGMRVVPVDMSDVWALEIDIGYYGGAVLDVETRLEVRELDFPKGIGDADSDSGSARDMSSDLFEEFEYFGKHLNLVEGAGDVVDPKEECDPKPDGLKISKSSMSASSNGSRWKSLLNSIAKQVSQVPLSLAIRITSLRGTLRLHIKPPPSDRLWFGFTSMPDIDFNLDSSVGDHKITSGRIALFLISRFKAAIRETLVLPNFENVCIPWMLAEKDDWVPRKTAPFIWVNQESSDSRTIFSEVPTEEKYRTESDGGTSADHSQGKNRTLKQADSVEKTRHDPINRLAFSVGSKGLSAGSNNTTSRELRTPLLVNGEPQETRKNKLDDIAESQSPSRSVILFDKQNSVNSEDDESKSKRVGRRARMLDLGKKMGEKLEEKRRSIEEKSRNIVEKMRGP
ncbi:PREDICTED: uncharacterized protein LOC101303523 [Fragaria vesca subsp. vesca]|uniref:uncharacterized protein LOC101303523 n=1 Tax=Fragaria vesca subsp. vesca TaxID=101020 RepID=UPI0002C2EA45|nr:PREDICTED: uncharacterized protein LOC101303523 [Fragaria vesca subsp. vesca]